MSPTATFLKPKIVYPESDGQPMAENTLQFRWIVTIQGGLDELFRDDPNVFVAGDLLWYPVEGDNKLRQAPDALVVFGRPKGDRGSYRQWDEEHIAPQVVFEVLSPGNRSGEMIRKQRFYEKYGVDEYYIYDPDDGDFTALLRDGDLLRNVAEPIGWTSPRLGIRFEMDGVDLQLIRPDGRLFLSYLDLAARGDEALQRAELFQQQAELSQQQAELFQQRAETERLKVERLIAQLQAAGIQPDVP